MAKSKKSAPKKAPVKKAPVKKAAVKKAAVKKNKAGGQHEHRLYTLDVCLISGPITEKFAKKNPVVSRMIQIRGDQTLADLHYAIFAAFGRFDEHIYEFRFGKKPMDPKGPRYVLAEAGLIEPDDDPAVAGHVDQTTIESLALKVKRRFAYWFDFGDDWMHQIKVVAIDDEIPKGEFPKVTQRTGESPPQYQYVEE